jgi:uncharacterized protein (TIGR02246 family)
MDVSTTETITQQLRRCNDAFEAAFPNQDSVGLAALYTTDGVLLPPGMAEMKGTEAIQQFWQGAMQMGVGKAKLTTVEAEEYGDTAIEQGQFVLSGADGSELDHGKYIVVWKRQGDQWYLQRDIWNSSRSA